MSWMGKERSGNYKSVEITTQQIDEIVSVISSHQLYEVPVYLIVFLSIAYGAVSLAAVIGNSAVLWFVVRSHRLRTVTNIFIGNLAIADILIGALAIPFQFVAALLQRWVLPHFMCAFCPFVQIVSVNVSIFTLAAIAADRYLIVVHPLNSSLRITKSRAKKIIIIIWTVATVVALPAIFALRVRSILDVDDIKDGLETLLSNVTAFKHDLPNNITLPTKYQCDNYGLDRDVWKWYNRILVVTQYVLPVSILIFAYGKMGLQLRDRSSDLKSIRRSFRDPKETSQVDHVASFNSASDNRPVGGRGLSSDIELSIHSNPMSIVVGHRPNQKASTSPPPPTDMTINSNRTQSITTNAEYIATNKRRVLKTLLIVVALFALCWLPLQTYYLLQDLFPRINEYRYINVIWFVCHFLAMSNSCLNPFVYAIYTLQ